MITQERLKELVNYDPETGIFTWKMKRKKSRIGDVAGGLDNHGYIRLGLDWKMYPAHRLAFLYMTGTMPTKFVRYLNGDKTDVRWANLKLSDGYRY